MKKNYIVMINGISHIIKAYSARTAINGVIKSLIGTRVIEKMLSDTGLLNITVEKR